MSINPSTKLFSVEEVYFMISYFNLKHLKPNCDLNLDINYIIKVLSGSISFA